MWVFFYLQDSDTSNRATLNYTVHACIQREVISVHQLAQQLAGRKFFDT